MEERKKEKKRKIFNLRGNDRWHVNETLVAGFESDGGNGRGNSFKS